MRLEADLEQEALLTSSRAQIRSTRGCPPARMWQEEVTTKKEQRVGNRGRK